MDIAIGLIDFNTPRVTEAAVTDLRSKFPGAMILVVENGTTRGEYGDAVVIRPGRNLGFAGGCNRLIGEARSRRLSALWIMNNDCVARADALRVYADAAEAGDADIYTSVALHGDTDRIWYGGGVHDPRTLRQRHLRYGEVFQAPPAVASFPTQWASGANMYLPQRTIERAERLDEDLFLYLEEVEWQLRSRLTVVCSNQALVRHHAGSTTSGVSTDLEFFFTARNRVRLAGSLGGSRRVRFWSAWLSDHVGRPVARGQWRRARVALLALRSADLPGAVALDKLRGAT